MSLTTTTTRCSLAALRRNDSEDSQTCSPSGSYGLKNIQNSNLKCSPFFTDVIRTLTCALRNVPSASCVQGEIIIIIIMMTAEFIVPSWVSRRDVRIRFLTSRQEKKCVQENWREKFWKTCVLTNSRSGKLRLI